MKCMILVGGYATRMLPLSENNPKALLPINDKNTVLDYIIDNIVKSTSESLEFILITNDTFYDNFVSWSLNKDLNIKVVSDGSTSNTDKVGAASALFKTINELNIQDDVFVLAGDNLLDFSLKYIFDEFETGDDSCVMYYAEDDILKLKKTGVCTIVNNYITVMEEKPNVPKDNKAVPPFYFLKSKDIKILNEKFYSNEKIDCMGEIILNLVKYSKVKAILMKGKRLDVGSVKEYYSIINKLDM